MTISDYQQLALRTESRPDLGIAPRLARVLHGMIGLATEVGELQDAVKKHLFYGKELDGTNIVEEIGDIFWYCAIVLDAYDATFEDAMTKNINKLRVRYPDKYSDDRALNRDLAAERGVLEGENL